MRITALIAASLAALSLAAVTSPASADTALQESPGIAGSNYMVNSVNDQGLDNDRGHIGQHDIGANSASMQLIDTAALGAAGHRGHALPT